MGFDVIHMNLHKTFSTPHGGGGPGAGAVGVSRRLLPLSCPRRWWVRKGRNYRWLDEQELPQTIGRLSTFMGNAGVLLRAYASMRACWDARACATASAEFATLNANYLQARLRERGFDLAFPRRRASHEFIVTVKRQKQEIELTATDIAKRLLDYGYHAPTTYFPLLIPECLLIEPTETEDRQTLDAFVEAMCAIWEEAKKDDRLCEGRALHHAGAPTRRRPRRATPARRAVRRLSSLPMAASTASRGGRGWCGPPRSHTGAWAGRCARRRPSAWRLPWAC